MNIELPPGPPTDTERVLEGSMLETFVGIQPFNVIDPSDFPIGSIKVDRIRNRYFHSREANENLRKLLGENHIPKYFSNTSPTLLRLTREIHSRCESSGVKCGSEKDKEEVIENVRVNLVQLVLTNVKNNSRIKESDLNLETDSIDAIYVAMAENEDELLNPRRRGDFNWVIVHPSMFPRFNCGVSYGISFNQNGLESEAFGTDALKFVGGVNRKSNRLSNKEYEEMLKEMGYEHVDLGDDDETNEPNWAEKWFTSTTLVGPNEIMLGVKNSDTDAGIIFAPIDLFQPILDTSTFIESVFMDYGLFIDGQSRNYYRLIKFTG